MNRQRSEELNLDAGEPRWFGNVAATGNGGEFALVEHLPVYNHLNPTPLTAHALRQVRSSQQTSSRPQLPHRDESVTEIETSGLCTPGRCSAILSSIPNVGGASDRIRTCGRRGRNPLLCSAELRRHMFRQPAGTRAWVGPSAAASSRRYGRRGSNPHGAFAPPEFEPGVSTIFTTSAKQPTNPKGLSGTGGKTRTFDLLGVNEALQPTELHQQTIDT